jgi:hypothetical protein
MTFLGDSNYFKLYSTQFYFNVKLYYYRYFNPYKINHYNIINKLHQYKYISSNYFQKYPTAKNWGNLNEELFKENPSSKTEFYSCSKEQDILKNQVVSDIKLICKNNKECILCSEWFQNFYIKYDYHIEQNIDGVIDYIKNDVIKMENNSN